MKKNRETGKNRELGKGPGSRRKSSPRKSSRRKSRQKKNSQGNGKRRLRRPQREKAAGEAEPRERERMAPELKKRMDGQKRAVR